MPSLLGDPSEKLTQQKAADLTAWFVSQACRPGSNGLPAPETNSPANLEKLLAAGAETYEVSGCINCHHFSVDEQPDEYQRHSLALIKRKFTASQLVRFLKSPQEHHRWSRMPDFNLSNEEAGGLSAYLIENSKGKIQNAMIPPAGSPQRGQTLYETLGCIQCHRSLEEARPVVSKFQPVPLNAKSLSAGCLADPAQLATTIPVFSLSSEQRAAIQTVLETASDSLFRRNAAETADRWFQQL
ncbi:MAG TPA: hypothetical protein DCM07_31750, partial [Planctomycetaceae bacterium]|nr:hypothetical protein [Planctomycetaceae bacterium]